MRNDDDSPVGKTLDYVERVNLAIDHIVAHLDQPMPLDAVAEVAGFSAFHFHRVFQSIVGETLSRFVRRLRLERALSMLTHAPGRSLTEVALICGFASSSDFSRSFKQRYGVPPSAFDVEALRVKNRQGLHDAMAASAERYHLERLPVGENPDGFEVALRDLPARAVAYIRVLDPYQPDVVAGATEQLVEWAESRGFADGQWLGYMWDDPEIVALPDCRYDVAVEVAESFVAAGEVGRFEFPAMRVAQVEVRGSIELELRAIDWLYRTWLPGSGLVPASLPAFEAWIGRPFSHGFEHFGLLCQLPVERAWPS